VNSHRSGENVKNPVDMGNESILNETNALHGSERSEESRTATTSAVDIKDDWEVVNYDIEASDAAQESRMASSSGEANF
jgi:hypothetical protein